MVAAVEKIDFPEIFVGFVAPIGTNIAECVNIFRRYFEGESYHVIELKVTDIFKLLSTYLVPKLTLVPAPLMDRYLSYIAYGDQVRSTLEEDAALAALTIPRIMRRRVKATNDSSTAPEKKVYLIHQFKRPEEIELFRSVYGRLFFQVSIYSRRGARVRFLSEKFAQDANFGNAEPFRADAEKLVQIDQNEIAEPHGQRLSSFDDRDYKRGFNSNENRKKELLRQLVDLIGGRLNFEDVISRKEILSSQFMDALEYSRVIHAEMSAICDAARVGRSLQGATLFCTTFPCHMCAKHIVASGIRRVIFLEPYPKSLAGDLHSDSICIEGADRGRYDEFPAVNFTHFSGISPRRYREIFERRRRKADSGAFQEWVDDVKRPIIDIKYPFYSRLEQSVVEGTVQAYLSKIRATQDVFD